MCQWLQVPPAFSAIRVDGKRSYEAARAGKAVEIAPRPRQVREFTLRRDDASSPHVHYRIVCGKGTYVRSLAHDLVSHAARHIAPVPCSPLPPPLPRALCACRCLGQPGEPHGGNARARVALSALLLMHAGASQVVHA